MIKTNEQREGEFREDLQKLFEQHGVCYFKPELQRHGKDFRLHIRVGMPTKFDDNLNKVSDYHGFNL